MQRRKETQTVLSSWRFVAYWWMLTSFSLSASLLHDCYDTIIMTWMIGDFILTVFFNCYMIVMIPLSWCGWMPSSQREAPLLQVNYTLYNTCVFQFSDCCVCIFMLYQQVYHLSLLEVMIHLTAYDALEEILVLSVVISDFLLTE